MKMLYKHIAHTDAKFGICIENCPGCAYDMGWSDGMRDAEDIAHGWCDGEMIAKDIRDNLEMPIKKVFI